MSGGGSNSFPPEKWIPGNNKNPDGSGNPGGSDSPGGGHGGSPEQNQCSSLFETTILNSPNPDVINKLKLNDILDVELTNQGRVLVVSYKNDIAGSITSPKLIKFIECIQAGFKYVAIVTSINGGQCQVSIRPAVKK